MLGILQLWIRTGVCEYEPVAQELACHCQRCCELRLFPRYEVSVADPADCATRVHHDISHRYRLYAELLDCRSRKHLRLRYPIGIPCIEQRHEVYRVRVLRHRRYVSGEQYHRHVNQLLYALDDVVEDLALHLGAAAYEQHVRSALCEHLGRAYDHVLALVVHRVYQAEEQCAAALKLFVYASLYFALFHVRHLFLISATFARVARNLSASILPSFSTRLEGLNPSSLLARS